MRIESGQRALGFLLLVVLIAPSAMAVAVGQLATSDEAPAPWREGIRAADAVPPAPGTLPAHLQGITMGARTAFEATSIPGTRHETLRIEPAAPWLAAADHPEPEFQCPSGNEESLFGLDDPNVNVVRGGCPFRVIDEIDLLGSPQLAVRHDDPREMAFFSLHGAATTDGPTPRSRDPQNPTTPSAQSQTTFTSKDGGWNWEDHPHGNEGYGETSAGVMSRDGNMFIAYLFSRPAGTDSKGVEVFAYHFRLYKENTAVTGPGYKGYEIEARAPGNIIDEVNLVVVPPSSQIETQEEYERYMENRTEEPDQNGTAPSDDGDVGNYTIPRDAEDYSEDLIAAVWHEKAYDYLNSPTGKSSWIDVVWTDASSRDDWHKMPDPQVVGPCRDASNPVAFNGRVYVACVVDAGYTGRRGAQIGDVDIWQFDLQNEKKQLMSWVPGMQDGRPRLAANEEGRFVITSSKPVGFEEPFAGMRVEMSWGWYGRRWDGSVIDVGANFYNIWGVPIRDARITNMVVLDDTPVVYMTYMERANTTIANPSLDPNGPPDAAVIEYHKAIGIFESCVGQPKALYNLQVGAARHPFQDGLVGDATGVFDDLHDGLAVARQGGHPLGKELVFFAIGDHGVIQYGALDGSHVLADTCLMYNIPPVFFTPVPPVATPLLVSSGLGVGVSTALVAPAAVGLGSLLIAKRKAALAAAVKARK